MSDVTVPSKPRPLNVMHDRSAAPAQDASGPTTALAEEAVPARPTLAGHVSIARVDHWVKNVFVLPGGVAAVALADVPLSLPLLGRFALGLLIVGLVASSNYTINEVLDAPYDLRHPKKRHRPVPSGRVSIPLAYAQWITLGALGVGLGATLSTAFALTMLALWVMGCVYNIPPVRSKDVPYLDVLTEAINNPIRMIAGWYLVVDGLVPPAALLLAYWMVGCYFMGIKRLNEVRELGGAAGVLAQYRRSLAYFTPERMLVAIMFYGASAMLFFGAFLMRYRVELVLAFPLVALVMACYMELGFRDDSAAQNPEKLYREPLLMRVTVACVVCIAILMFVDLPVLHQLIDPSFLGAVRPSR